MNIKLFHQVGCPMCKAVEMMLKKHNFKYESSQNVEEMKKLGIAHTPALLVDDQILSGHDIIDWINSHKEAR